MSELEFQIGEQTFKTTSAKNGEETTVKIGDNEITFKPLADDLYQVRFDGSTHIVAAIKYKDTFFVDIDSCVIEVREAGAEQSNGGASSHSAIKDKIFAPMPGKIVKLMVKSGDSVTEKQPLVVVEAMKMENQVNSPAKGKVKSINFGVGDQVSTTSPIIELDLSD